MNARRILITGASAGLGAALARRFAASGTTLLLCARRAERFKPLAEELRAKGAEVQFAQIDTADSAALRDWIAQIWRDGPVDVAILNAGVFSGRTPDGRAEQSAAASSLIATNLTGSIVAGLELAEKMRARRAGHLVFISSLAAFSPSADAPSYSASKAGLTSFARGLREDLAPANVQVSLVHPGHVATRQTAQHIGPLPGLVQVDDAAALIMRGLTRGRAEIAFPIHLRWALAVVALLPWRVQMRINRSLRFRVKPPETPSGAGG